VLQPQSASGPNEGNVTIASYTTSNGQYGDATPYSLQKPNYSFSGTTPTFFSARIAPQLVGLGLLEAVSESTIQALADPDDANADGISGRMHPVLDPGNRSATIGAVRGQSRSGPGQSSSCWRAQHRHGRDHGDLSETRWRNHQQPCGTFRR
jgi:CxxC motif-containing protein (DUF1111 family)